MDQPAPAERKRSRASNKRNDDSLPFLPGTATGALPAALPAALADDFRLADLAPIIRPTIGPRDR